MWMLNVLFQQLMSIKKQLSAWHTSHDLICKHDIHKYRIHTHDIVPPLDALDVPAPGQTDAALARVDRVTVQNVVD